MSKSQVRGWLGQVHNDSEETPLMIEETSQNYLDTTVCITQLNLGIYDRIFITHH
jgi:hypothetical protein